ncbi:MAG: glycosyltransferase family 1 protein [Gammaproteobacteria bacterium]|nr:MAG: glycosyltransferase family 1 protein [Gammaproteobacteria bacterium]UTW41613.1 glycosyltransferase [bacterium SCSIO 12844]
MKILLISDQKAKSDHSSVEGLFYNAINQLSDVNSDVVYFSDQLDKASWLKQNKIQVPKRTKHIKIIKCLSAIIDLNQYDFIVIRNYFSTLRQFLKVRKKFNFKVGFWESFPHNYRRYEEAKRFRKSLWRKSIEWYFKYKYQKSLINRSDFYLPISQQLQDDFYLNLTTASYPLSLGVDVDILPKTDKKVLDDSELTSFVYTGTIDQLRNFDIILDAFLNVKEAYKLFIYTASNNDCVKELQLRSQVDPRIHWCVPLKRDDLFNALIQSDIAVGIFPESKTYRSASPTKTIEYFGIGLPALLNHIPEYDLLFNNTCAFFCEFNQQSIHKAIEKIVQLPKSQLVEMGKKGREIILEKRSYQTMAKSLIDFLQSL